MAQLDWLDSTIPLPASLAVPVPSSPQSFPMQSSERDVSAKAEGAYRTISEVSEELDVPTHVLRFWESKFPQVKPQRMRGGRRYYRPSDVETLKKIKTLLYSQGYTIKGARKHVKDKAHEIHAEPQTPPQLPQAELNVQNTVPEAPVVPKKSPPEISALLNELRELKKTLTSFS